jgi:UPF0716 protein FxsA
LSINDSVRVNIINDSVRVNIMNLKKVIPVFLLLIPIIEIILFIEIGSIIGSFNTILTIFGTAIVGIYIIKYNAATYMSEIRNKLMNGLRPDQEILSGIIVFICGVFLLLPGFLTDFIGLLFLYKPIRLLSIKRYDVPSSRRPNGPKGRVIDVDHNKDE